MQKIIEKLIQPNSGIIWAVLILTISCLIFPPADPVIPLVGMAYGILATLAKGGGDGKN